MGSNESIYDTGYSWLVLVAAFFGNVMGNGVIMCPAVYMVEWAECFQTSRANVAIIGSINTALVTLVGVVSGALIQRFNSRAVMFCGSIIATVGLVISVFAVDTFMLYFTFGGVAGVGVGLMYIPPIVVIYDYFDKYKSFASGIALCGHSVAVIAVPPLLTVLVQIYGWRGSMLFFAGFILNGCVLAFAFRPVPKDSRNSDDNSKTLITQESIKSPENRKKLNNDLHENARTQETTEQMEAPKTDVVSNEWKEAPDISTTEEYMGNAMFKGSYEKENPKTTIHDGSMENSTKGASQVAVENPNLLTTDTKTEKPKTTKSKSSLKDTFVVSILTQRTYLLFACAYACTLFQLMVSYQLYTSKAIAEGLSKVSATLLISVIGISAAASRVLFSFIANFRCTNHVALFGACGSVLGLLNIFSFIPWDFISHAFMVVAMGTMAGGVFTLTPPALVSLVGTERLPGAYGWIGLFSCLQSLSLPLAGWLYDVTGTFDASFIMAGGVGLLGGVLIVILLIIVRKQERRNKDSIEAPNVEDNENTTLMTHTQKHSANGNGNSSPVKYIECKDN